MVLIALAALNSLKPPGAPAPLRLERVLASGTAGLAPSPISPARAATAPPVARLEPPRGPWAMATPPTWLTTVDPAAGLGPPASVDAGAPIADTVPRPQAVGLAAVTALVLPPQTLAARVSVPLPRPRPPASTRP